MNIIILGAGRVGESVAESLVSEQNDITVIDQDPARLRALEGEGRRVAFLPGLRADLAGDLAKDWADHD